VYLRISFFFRFVHSAPQKKRDEEGTFSTKKTFFRFLRERRERHTEKRDTRVTRGRRRDEEKNRATFFAMTTTTTFFFPSGSGGGGARASMTLTRINLSRGTSSSGRDMGRRRSLVVAPRGAASRGGESALKKGEQYYVGGGKWIRDQDGLGNAETKLVSDTGRDAFVGGFAGGEKRLLEYKRALNEAGAGDKAKKKKKQRKETKDVVLAKDFNNAAGGIFYGEVGLQSWKETGRIPTRSKEATVGWGPPVLLAAAAAAGVTYKTTGALTVDAVTKTVESVSSGVSNIDGVVGKIGGAVGALDKGASALPTQAALVGFGVLALYALLGKIMNTAKKTSGDFVKIALFVTITWTIAKQILQ
jgi:hypothetical protein